VRIENGLDVLPAMAGEGRDLDQILATIVLLRTSGITVLLVEQNASVALEIADRGYVMETGRIVSTGEGSVLLSDPKVKAAYLGAD
jgi:branched-chain amino acid transport system ATP-binding protein